MNIAFWILVLLAIIMLWFSLASRFKPVGKELSDMYNEAKDAMSEDEKERE